MHVATVTYTGRRRHVRRRLPSGEEYVFSSGTRAGTDSQKLSSYADAERFAEVDVYEVEWTGFGRVLQEAGGTVSAVEQAVGQMQYQTKKSLASKLGLSGSGTEEELNERLEPAIEELREEMEGNDL